MYSNLKQLCKLAGIKQEALARQVGVKQGVISNWSNNMYYPSVENLITLSRVLNVSTDCILGLEPIPEGYPDGHIQPVIYNEAIAAALQEESTEKAPRPQRMPFTKEQMEYLDTWGNRLKDEFVSALKETSSLLSEQEPEAK